MSKGNKSRTTALVFCGGEGTRMEPISSLFRKEMLPIGPQRMPLLANIVEHLKTYGIKDIVFMNGNKENDYDVVNFFGDGKRFGINARHFTDPPKCQGNGHALLWAIKKLGLKGKNLLIYYGDMYNTINLKELMDTHCTMGVAATIAVSDRWEIPKGIVTISPNRMVLKFEEKPRWHGPEKIAVGLLCLDVNKFLNTCEPLPSKVNQLGKSRYKDIMGDIIGDLVDKGHVAYHLTDSFWHDIGSFQDYRIVHKALMHKIKKGNVQKQVKKTSIGRHPSIFLSYKISEENKAIVENCLSPILQIMKYKILSGAKLNEAHVSGPPSERARKLISTCNKLVAIATPDDDKATPGDDNYQPSPYVLDEVACAKTLDKKVFVFVQKKLIVPRHWREQFVYTEVDIKKPAELIKDVIKIIGRVD